METIDWNSLSGELEQLLERPEEDLLASICLLLHDRVSHYDWVGFYLTDPGTRLLRLGPYVGEATEHTEIPFGRGICGQAAERKATFTVQDVSAQENYLACSLKVRSEIVVPIMRGESVLGEIDIDSHRKGPFGDEDRRLLEWLADRVAAHL